MFSFLSVLPPWAKWAALAAAVLVIFSAGWTVRGWRADAQINQIKATIAQERESAVIAARVEERRQQEIVNEALRKQNEKVAAINSRLARDLDGLRTRPARLAGVSQGPRPDCQGSTGAELSRPDAEFLVGEAARADLLRAALTTCYEVIDATK